MSTFPATNSREATELIIDSGNQLHKIINEDATTEVLTESGYIPSVRKALADTFLFQDPIPWDQGSDETAFNQLRTFDDDIYWAPTATTLNPIPMGSTPVGDSNWSLAPVNPRGYKGLWPDADGSALKGETWQTQIGGTPTGEYYTALQDTSVDPIEDNVNWKRNGDVNLDNLSDYTYIVYKSSGGKSPFRNMLDGSPVKSNVGDRCSTGSTNWLRVAESSPSAISDFIPLNQVCVDDLGAKGDYYLFELNLITKLLIGQGGIVNPTPTDDTNAIRTTLNNFSNVCFTKEKSYLVSDCFVMNNGGYNLQGNDCNIVYKGGKPPSRDITGIFQFQGSGNRYQAKAVAKASIKVFDSHIDVEKSTNTLSAEDMFYFFGYNGVTDTSASIRKESRYMCKVRLVEDIDENTVRIHHDYKHGWSFDISDPNTVIQLGTVNQLFNIKVENFNLIDHMPATKTDPLAIPIPEAPSAEKDEAVGLVRFEYCSDVEINNLTAYHQKWSIAYKRFCSHVKESNLRTYHPTWCGGGEGYVSRVTHSWGVNTDNISMIEGRHAIDYTSCGWCNVSNSNAASNNVGFSTHTNSEHDITFTNIVTDRLTMNNPPYGAVSVRIKFENCVAKSGEFKCLDLTLDNCTFTDELEITCVNANIMDTTAENLNFIKSEERVGSTDVVREYSYPRNLYIDSGCVFGLSKTYPFLDVTGFFNANIDWYLYNHQGFEGKNVFFRDMVGTYLKGRHRDVAVTFTGSSRTIDLTHLRVSNPHPDNVGSTINFAGINVPVGEYQNIKIYHSTFELNGTQRPYQIVSRGDEVRPYDIYFSGGNNVMTNHNLAIFDDLGANINCIGFSYEKDATIPSLATVINVANDAVRYDYGDVNPVKGSTGGPAVWNGSSWVDLT